MERARAYVDSDILIWHLRGDARAADLLRGLAAEATTDLWVGALQRAEIIFFMRPHETAATLQLLAQFRTHAVTEDVVDHAGTLFRQWHPSHSIDVNDALLAAMVLSSQARLFTLNVKHYPMPGLRLIKGW